MTTSYPNHPIGPGSKDKAAVKAIQSRLNELGVAKCEVDGDFGPSTEAAVKLFQARALDSKSMPLTIDGEVGPMTWAALFNTTPVKVKSAGALDAVIAKAVSQIGVLEDPPKSNRGKQVEAYLASVGLKGGYAWCAAFVHWCFREAMGDANPCPKSGGVIDLWHQIGAKKKRRLTPAQATANPALVTPGMLFFLDTGGGYGHVGFVEKVQGVYLTTIEGNTNEGGSRDGIGVFRRKTRTIGQVNLGFADLSRSNV